MQSINPHNGQILRSYRTHTSEEVDERVRQSHSAFASWSKTPIKRRAELFRNLAAVLRQGREELADLMNQEMGKIKKEGLAEIDKCADGCSYYADHAADFLARKEVKSDAKSSYISYEPLGAILAVMPWNFPFWQVIRFAAPGLMAGNTALLKHAANVCGAALALEQMFLQAGFPAHVFTSLLISGEEASQLLSHPLVKAVTLTGSTAAGQAVAAAAGRNIKKSVLELGGSDPYLILDDADLDQAVRICVQSRLINAGQSCIAAKRFIVDRSIKAAFERGMKDQLEAVRWGPVDEALREMGPMARADLRDELHAQLVKSQALGARLLCGGKMPSGPGFYYPPSLLTDVKPGMPAFDEELFGPVAAIIEAKDEDEAIHLANQSNFGLGAALFTRDGNRAARLVPRIEAGSVFVNALVKSDPRLPFGGIKQSGYGRELSQLGIREFVNIKTVYFA